MIGTKQSEVTVARLVDERAGIHHKHESKLEEVNRREDPMPTEDERDLLKRYREQLSEYDAAILEMTLSIDADRAAEEESKKLRRVLADGPAGIEVDGDGLVYRDFNAYAFDYFITRTNVSEAVKIARQWGVNEDDVMSAKQRLDLVKRTPANTLSSNIGGLTPPQHIDQIFQVINNSRPIVGSARRSELVRGTLTYPRVDTKPVVAVQGTEKTEAGNTGLAVSMQTTTATTYLGGGDLSWQAINWSTPNALRLWFDIVTADYALKTEQDAAQALQHSAFSNNIASTLAASSTFAQWMTAIGAGYSEVFANSGRTANTLYLAPDLYGYLLGLTSNAFTQFMSVSGSNIGPFNIVVSRGMDAGVAAVGDAEGLLVAETPGAPVEMQVVEPAIGGVEVGLIGAFEAVVVDNGAFAMITTAS